MSINLMKSSILLGITLEAFHLRESDMIQTFKRSVIYSSKISGLRESDINVTKVVDMYALRASNRRRAALYEHYSRLAQQSASSKTFAKLVCGEFDHTELFSSNQGSLEAIKIGYIVRSELSDVGVGTSELSNIISEYKSKVISDSFANDMTDFLKNDTLFAAAIALDPIIYSITYNYTLEVLHSGSPSSQPTAMPSCGDGSFGSPADCGPCSPGTYTSIGGRSKCTPCEQMFYSDTYGAATCQVRSTCSCIKADETH